MQVRGKHRVAISKGFATLENLDESEHINMPWNNTRHGTQSHLKRVWVITNGNSTNLGLTKNF